MGKMIFNVFFLAAYSYDIPKFFILHSSFFIERTTFAPCKDRLLFTLQPTFTEQK